MSIVSLAFSVELYVKAVYQAFDIKAKNVHNILELFNGLPQEIQNRIFEIHMPNSYNTTLETYKTRIAVISRGFEELRYFHEKKTANYHQNFAQEMIISIKKLLTEKGTKNQPDLRECVSLPINN